MEPQNDQVQSLQKEADALYAKARFDEAERLYEELLTHEPEHAFALNRLGAIAAQRGDFELAEERFEAALAIQPTLAQAHMNLGNLLYERADYEGALEKYLQALELAPDLPTVHENLGAVYKKLGKIDLAVKHRRKAGKLGGRLLQEESKQATRKLGRKLGCLPSVLLLLLGLLLFW